MLCKILGPVLVRDDFCIRYKSELFEVLNDMDVVQGIIIERQHWLGHAVRMKEDTPARWVFAAGICRSRYSRYSVVMINYVGVDVTVV